MENKSPNILLDDVVLIRLLLILLLVLYHSFCIFSGAWEVPDSYLKIPIYSGIAQTSYSFMLESFVFISGYLYGHQVWRKGTNLVSFEGTILKKAKRCLLPCFFFGVIYYWMFYDLTKPIHQIIYSILNGTGHLWFLPMLFGCFVGIYIIEKLHFSPKAVIPLLAVFALCSILPLPFRLDRTMYYFLFFYMGYSIMRNSWNVEVFFTGKCTLICGVLYISAFVLSVTILGRPGGGQNLTKVANFVWNQFSTLCYSSFGTALVYCGVNWLQRSAYLQTTVCMVRLSSLCFGVYIYQQFILKILYYEMDGLHRIDALILPWVGFLITLFLSIALSHLTMKTRFGKFLIG